MIPQELKDNALWCVWSREVRSGNPTKVPYNPRTGNRAETNNPDTFDTFEIAEEAYKTEGRYNGVGILVGNGFSAIDIDHCIEDGVMSELAETICQLADSYTETSPSGTGLRIIIKGDALTYDRSRYYLKNPSNGVEFYVSGMTNRFMTITGNTVYDRPIRYISKDELTRFLEKFMLRPIRQHAAHNAAAKPVTLEDEQIISKANQNEKFRALFSGEISAYNNDHSSADLALCNFLAFWTGRDAVAIDRLFRQSALYREKWERSDYRNETIRKAIDSCSDVYNPEEFRTKVAEFTDATKVAKYLSSVNRNVPPEDMEAAVDTLETKFSAKELTAIRKAADKPPAETTVAREIINAYNLIYVDQVGFYQWDGRVWQKLADELVRQMAAESYNYFATAQRVAAVCKLIKALTVSEVIFDRKPVLTFQNGTLEIETGKFRGFSQDDYCSIILDYDYDPIACCPQWRKFINDITDDEPTRAEILQTMAGYVLFPDCRFQKIFILLGGGSNGKSVYLEIIQKLFGDKNVSVVSPTGLTKEFERVKIKDSLLNMGKDVSPDFSTGEIREQLLQISDGTMIQACYKGQTHITFEPRCKLIYSMNKAPTASVIEGLNRRLHFIKFPCSFVDFPDPTDPKQKPKDVTLISKLLKELPGIFNWAYDGYKLLNTVGYFTDAPEQEDITRQFEETSDPVSVFCKDRHFAGTITRNEIYEWYKMWCDETGHRALSRERFMPRFTELMEKEILTEGKRRIGGVNTRYFEFKT